MVDQQYRCSVCGGTEFVAKPERPRRSCGGCGALERHRYLAGVLAKEQFAGKRVLEVGPLTSEIFGGFLKRRGADYCSVDRWKTGNPADRRDVQFVDRVVDVIDLARHFGCESFDYVIMQHVLEEVDQYLDGLRNIAAVLRPGGSAWLEIPVSGRHPFDHTADRSSKFGNVWDFGSNKMMRELIGAFGSVLYDPFSECGFDGHLFVCSKNQEKIL